MLAPTLVTACTALPPEGAVPCLGRPGAAAARTLVTACIALPPEGAVPCLGQPGAAANCAQFSSADPKLLS